MSAPTCRRQPRTDRAQSRWLREPPSSLRLKRTGSHGADRTPSHSGARGVQETPSEGLGTPRGGRPDAPPHPRAPGPQERTRGQVRDAERRPDGPPPPLAAGPQTPPLTQTPNPRPSDRPAPVRPAPAPGCVPAPAPSRGLRAPAARPALPPRAGCGAPRPHPSPSLPTYPPPLPAGYPPSRSGFSAASGQRLRLRRRGTRRGAARRGELDIPWDPRSRVPIARAPALEPPSSPPLPPPPPSARRSATSREPARSRRGCACSPAARHGQPPLGAELPVSTAAPRPRPRARPPARRSPRAPLSPPAFVSHRLLHLLVLCLQAQVRRTAPGPAGHAGGRGRAGRGRRTDPAAARRAGRAGKHLRTATPNYPEEGLRTREVAPASGHTACEWREARTRGFGVWRCLPRLPARWGWLGNSAGSLSRPCGGRGHSGPGGVRCQRSGDCLRDPLRGSLGGLAAGLAERSGARVFCGLNICSVNLSL